jgi:hypothetical protein
MKYIDIPKKHRFNLGKQSSIWGMVLLPNKLGLTAP